MEKGDGGLRLRGDTRNRPNYTGGKVLYDFVDTLNRKAVWYFLNSMKNAYSIATAHADL